MFIVFKDRNTLDQVQLTGVKSVSFDGTTYTVTKSDDSIATFAASQYLMWSFT